MKAQRKNQAKSILKHLAKDNRNLARKIQYAMFNFEHLVNADRRGLARFIKTLDRHVLLMALRLASDPLKQTIYNSMSPRAAEMLQDDLETMPKVPRIDVEAAQRSIANRARQWVAQGQLIITGVRSQYV